VGEDTRANRMTNNHREAVIILLFTLTLMTLLVVSVVVLFR
jgi:hypothetical protein